MNLRNIRENYKSTDLKQNLLNENLKKKRIFDSYGNHIHCLKSGVNCTTFKKSVMFSMCVIHPAKHEYACS